MRPDQPNAIIAVLHGSRATGHAHDASDWDVAVLADHTLSPDERFALKRSFAAKLGVPEDKLDIADLRSDAPLLRYRVAMHGKLLEGDPREFLAFRIRAWKQYLNNEKFQRLQSAFLEKSLS